MPRKPKRSSWGTKTEVSRGTWRLRYWADLKDGRGYRRVSETFHGTRREADMRLSECMVSHAEDVSVPTMEQAYFTCWLPDAEDRLGSGELALNTLNAYKGAWRNQVAPKWGKRPVNSIKPIEVQSWLMSLTRWKAVNAKLLASMVAAIAIMMYDLGCQNVFARSYRMPKAATERTKQVWTREQCLEAAERVSGSVVEVPAILCALGSCRVGEACAPKVSDISLSTEAGGVPVARVAIGRQLLKEGNRVTGTLKNKQSRRTVCVPGAPALRLMEIAGEMDGRGLPYLNDAGEGAPVRRSIVQEEWKRAFEPGGPLHGMPYVTMQNLRNSWETYMRWELHVPADMIDSMMGHAGKHVRTQFYDRPSADVFAETCAIAYRGGFKPKPHSGS